MAAPLCYSQRHTINLTILHWDRHLAASGLERRALDYRSDHQSAYLVSGDIKKERNPYLIAVKPSVSIPTARGRCCMALPPPLSSTMCDWTHFSSFRLCNVRQVCTLSLENKQPNATLLIVKDTPPLPQDNFTPRDARQAPRHGLALPSPDNIFAFRNPAHLSIRNRRMSASPTS